MVRHLLILVSVVGLMVGPSAGDAPEVAEDREMGGEGMGRIMGFLGFLGVILLAIVIILAILSVFGVFDAPFADPEA